ncbi:tetratricopeptide repeat protein [Oxalobacteraceae sp. CFBP 8761]|nr:tetratricopeptide repeat protein [Oxalobacteraceae sp. CFBP 8761]
MPLLHAISGLFSSLLPKDWITLTASLAALVVSIISYRQKSNEGRLALRKQLTDLIEKLIEVNTKYATFRLKPTDFPASMAGHLNDQRRFLVRQANFLAQHLETLVSPYEHLVLAGAYDEINDLIQAESYYQRAIGSSEDPFDKGMATRSFARYLFSHAPVRLDEARSHYEESVECFRGDTDRHVNYVGDTYVRWAKQELEWNNFGEGTRLLLKALTVFEQLANPTRKRVELEKVHEQIRDILEQDTPELGHLSTFEDVVSWAQGDMPVTTTKAGPMPDRLSNNDIQ